MAHIALPDGLPGIRGPLAFSPATSKPIRDLTQLLLHEPNTLSPGERELIAAYVSARNECVYCDSSHSATAACHLGNDEALVARVKSDPESAPISDKMKALLAIAGKVQRSGRDVTTEDVDRARRHGATDKEIHDTVLIAALFCMFNRYVDGLATFTPKNPEFYRESGANIVAHGYADPAWPRPTRTLEGEMSGAAEDRDGKN
jgi:uncharacterized peroxidase-related enzyme